MLEMDQLPELAYAPPGDPGTSVVTQPLLDCFSVRVHPGPGDCQSPEVALMRRLYGAEVNLFTSWPCS